MPIGSRSWRGFEPRMGSASPATKKALAGLVARFRSSFRLRARASIVLVVVLLVAGCGSGSTTPQGTTATPLVAANSTSPSASATAPTSASATAPTATVSASPVASNADADDETSSSAGASFAPNATGILPPTNGTGPADRLPGEPDPSLTPGVLNPAVTQATIHSTICVSGWTATIRPGSPYTGALKVQQIAQYGYGDTKTTSSRSNSVALPQIHAICGPSHTRSRSPTGDRPEHTPRTGLRRSSSRRFAQARSRSPRGRAISGITGCTPTTASRSLRRPRTRPRQRPQQRPQQRSSPNRPPRPLRRRRRRRSK